jgi:3-oxoacyl-[acyl-carrier-protein] synthase II
MDQDIVITGSGIVCSLGNTLAEVWDALLSSGHGIRPVEGFDASGFSCRTGAQVRGIDPSGLDIPRRDARIMGKHSCMLIKGSRDAYRTAKIDGSSVPGEDIGFFAGMGMVDYGIDDLLPAVLKSLGPDGSLDYDRFYTDGYQEIYPLWPLSMLNNISFCQAAIGLNIRGENTVFSPHADSGGQAVAEAASALLEKKATVVFAGGVSEVISPLSIARAGTFGVLNESGDESRQYCSPFGQNRKGTVLGEGCGIVSLETKSSADGRGTGYSARIEGYGYACEKEKDALCPSVSAMSQSMEHAVAVAGIRPDDIDVIIAHGDGTIDSDSNEAAAIHNVFHNCVDRMIVYSSKSALGNLLAAGPAVDVILGTCMIEHGIIPPIPFVDTPDSSVRFRLVTGGPLSFRPSRIMINAFSYEGQCTSLIIGAMPQSTSGSR